MYATDGPTFEFDLDPEVDRVYLVGATPTSRHRLSLFPVAGPVSIRRWSLPWAVTNLVDPSASSGNQKLTDAVAVAGVRATGHGSPRAVVLIVDGEPADTSRYDVEDVRHYLEQLRVPLHVWSTDPETSSSWDPFADANSVHAINKAAKRLLKQIDKHWIVWVEGRHLLHDIELDGDDLGIELVGRSQTKAAS